ncbi:argininosuccinate lyase [Colletotrichum higginsianum]|uniref:Arginosuccinase n=1 Tax=Colletotrichum higginsianum (strain IMI 349063) TaxID=759273 RepID=H1VCF8_COLHI|nr:Argininosuccinate lyase [Colletotrichum higginsianum IMI 349063]OBR04017.1 Argininosuccinate lyase [Colletotrichum higginsianum IMI 349063]CCF37911.1 argininosuccinate lyase [Colletotrichum higginsianum]
MGYGVSPEDLPVPGRDTFFWLGEINKASAVINSDEGLLDRAAAIRIASGLQKLLDSANEPNAPRPSLVITFEPLLIQAAGVEATLLHAGRSSQDMLTTVSTMVLRDAVLKLASQLHDTTRRLVDMAETHATTLVPNYTNGVAAQPNSYGHYLLGHVAGLHRDAERLRQCYTRLDRCAMGTTVLNGTSWPLNRERMAQYLGFAKVVDNAYDAAQISAAEMPVELGAIASQVALHAGAYIQDVMAQYSQPKPWILLREGGYNTYVSSAMPQKRNPGLLNNTRAEASRVVTLGVGRAIQGHNLPPGMVDAKGLADNLAVLNGATRVLRDWQRILDALVIDGKRSLKELDLDWTASQELADVLMREHNVPFRVGHHFASEVVRYAKAEDLCPSEFPFAEASRIFADTLKHTNLENGGFRFLSEDEFREALDPAGIVNRRATSGGPQPKEMERMIGGSKKILEDLEVWIQERRAHIEDSLHGLDVAFKLLLEV